MTGKRVLRVDDIMSIPPVVNLTWSGAGSPSLLATETDEGLKRQAKEAGAIGWMVGLDQLPATMGKVAGV